MSSRILVKEGEYIRYPAVAGQFYAGTESDLKQQIEGCFRHALGPGSLPELNRDGPRSIKGLVVPHAGYMFSGPVAAHAYHHLAADGFPESFIILGPNHTGYGNPLSLTREMFSTPLGNVPVDAELADMLHKGIIDDDILAHRHEHSIEVQLPFLQYIESNIRFVPVSMMVQDHKASREVGEIIREAVKGRDVVVIASTDFSHYIPQEAARQKDKLALDAILNLNSKELFKTVQKNSISMCGYGPVMAMLEGVGGGGAELLKYANSGDVRPMRDVVGYGAVAIR